MIQRLSLHSGQRLLLPAAGLAQKPFPASFCVFRKTVGQNSPAGPFHIIV